jgi:hypothetical protein
MIFSHTVTGARQRFSVKDTCAGFFCLALGILMCVPNNKKWLICSVSNSTQVTGK